MAWTTIANSEIDQDSPVTQPLMTALRDNPIAIANGDAGAPRVQAIAAMSHLGNDGAVGTYCFARREPPADVAFGSATSGSNLRPTSAAYGISVSTGLGSANLNSGSALAGTWRCMGQYDATVGNSSEVTLLGATLWLRIS